MFTISRTLSKCYGIRHCHPSPISILKDVSFLHALVEDRERFRRTFASSSHDDISKIDQTSPEPGDNRIPATIITGFLGSGKTTLLNHILTSQHGKRIAVIENEFGEVDIDGSLVASHSTSSDDIIMVNNGCLCCTVRGDLVKMLSKLVTKKDKFDHIVIETTGLAKPGPVIETLCSDEIVCGNVTLDGVVTMVDSKHTLRHLNEVKPRFVVNEAVEQIAYADRIILNKIDLVPETEINNLVHRIQHINSLAPMKLAKYGSVDMDFVLGIGGYDLQSKIDSELPVEMLVNYSHCHGNGLENRHRHNHDSAVSSVSIVSEGCLHHDEVDDWLERLIEEKGENLYRMKGVLNISGCVERYIFHGVHSTLDFCFGKSWQPGEKRVNKLVFIGKHLDENMLRKGFRGCLD